MPRPEHVKEYVGQDTSKGTGPARPDADRMLCDRCGAHMFRMHAVWRCPACGFKTDCCGW